MVILDLDFQEKSPRFSVRPILRFIETCFLIENGRKFAGSLAAFSTRRIVPDSAEFCE